MEKQKRKYVGIKDLDIRMILVLAIIGELLGLFIAATGETVTTNSFKTLLVSFLFLITGLIGLLIPAYRKDKSVKEIKTGWILVIIWIAIIGFWLLYSWLA